MNKKFAKIYKRGEEPDDVLYWRSCPSIEALKTLENIRAEYIKWKYGSQQRLQRVYRIVKRERS